MILQDANRLRFGWSFRAPGTAEKQNQLLRAWTRVPATVRQALSALDNVRTGGRRARGVPTGPFQDYFGGTAYLDIVKNKLGLVATMADTRDVKYLPGLGEAVVVNRPNGQQMNVVNPAKDPMNPGVKAARLDIKKNAVRTYGDDLCRCMAQRHPEKAAHNADSYAYYCMHFADGW
jgi:hypothetical protein